MPFYGDRFADLIASVRTHPLGDPLSLSRKETSRVLDTIQITENHAVANCVRCSHVNNLGGFIGFDMRCDNCGASLNRDIAVTYIKSCPLCGVHFDESKISMYTVSDDDVNYWTCKDCDDEPRAFYLHEVWAGDDPEPCCLCRGKSELMMFTQADRDYGQWLCNNCAALPQGVAKLAEHRAIMANMNVNPASQAPDP